MKKYINYLIILVIVLFGGVSRVEAREMACKYTNRDKDEDVYLYCAGNSADKCETVYVTRDGDKSTFVMSEVNEIVFGDNNTCPSKANKNGALCNGSSFDFGTGWACADYSKVEEEFVYEKKYTSWSLADSGIKEPYGAYSYNIKYNEYGFLSFTASNDSIIITNFNGSKPKFDSSVFSESGEFQFNTEKGSVNNSASDDSSDDSLSTDDSSGDSSSTDDSSSGSSAASNGESASSKGLCFYINYGYCSGTSGIVDDEKSGAIPKGCSDGSDNKYDHYFKRASHLIVEYSNGDILNVYMPKYNINSDKDVFIQNVAVSSLESFANSFDGSYSSLQKFMNNNFVKIDINTTNDSETLHMIVDNNANTDYVGQCPIWLQNVSGAGGDDYEDTEYWYQYYNTDPEENGKEEVPGGTGDEFTETQCDIFCEYNNGNLVMKFSGSNGENRLMVYSPTDVITSGMWSYNNGSGIADITWKSTAGAYGSSDGANNGEFEKLLLNGTCPAKLKYNPYDKELVICDKESDCEDDDNHYSATNPTPYQCSYNENIEESYESCKNLIGTDLREALNEFFLLFRIVVPILVGVLGVVDFAKAIFASKEDDMKKAQSTFVKRIMLAVVIFLLPTFVNLLLDIANTVWGWNADTCEIEKVQTDEVVE